MKVGVADHWRLNGMKIKIDLVIFWPVDPSLQKNKVKYSTVKCKHVLAVLVYFAEIFREIIVEKYKGFKGVNFYSSEL